MASDGTIKIDTELDSSKAKSAMSEFSSLAETALKGVKIAVGAVSAAMTAMAAYSVKVGSDFEAGMSKVSAISGATGSDLAALSDKAKEMGSKTKFSATEAASAFEFMAMAGWKTEDMLNGIEGVMNLAAASGEDLASVSDIITDALTGFGLQAGDSAHFADVLATAASNSNTNVGMMGETFKYVAPVAGALGFSAEDCAVAIGLMANSGIKASQAGTSLRQLFTNLVKPTDQMQEVMDKLGFSLMDAEGNTKSLDTVMKELRTSFAGLTDAEKAQYAATLAGQEGMSGFLAIVNASDSDFQGLTSAIGNADGAAEKMAETMNNNLKGSITIAGSALEGFGIKVYEKMEQPLKKAVDIGTDCINRLSAAFDSGGLNGVVKEAGDIFNELADDISGTSKVAAGIVTPFKNIANTGANLGKTVIPPAAKAFKLLAENLDLAIPLLVSGVTAIKSYSAAKTAASVIGKLSKAYTESALALDVYITANGTAAVATAASTGAITLKQIAVGVLTKQLGLATAAHAAFNAIVAANPIGLAVTAVAALTAGLVAYNVVSDKSKEKTYELSNSEKKLLDACNDAADALNNQRTAREAAIQSIDMEHDKYQNLVTNLQAITDENGKVKAGYEERAKVIAGELSDALGMEISYIEGEIQMNGESVKSMGEVCNAIDEVIVKRKAEALLASLEDDMAAAYRNSKEALLAYKDAVAVMEEKEKSLEDAQQNLNEVTELYGNNSGPKAMAAMREAKQAVDEAQNAFDEASAAVDGASVSLNELSAEVNNYDALMEEMENGTVEDIKSAMNALVSGYQEYTEEMLASSQTAKNEMITQAQETTSALSVLVKEHGQMYQALGDDAANASAKAVSEFQKLPGGIEEAVNEIGTDGAATMIAALAQADFDGKLSEESIASYEAFMAGLSDLPQGTQDILSEAVEGAMEGLASFDQIQDKAKEEGVSFLEALREVLQINSPSKKVMEIFEGVWEGASDGLDVGKDGLNIKGIEVCDSFLGTLRNSGLEEAMQGIGTQIMEFFGLGVSSQQENSRNSGKLNADAANEGAGSVDPTGTGSNFGAMLGNGVSSMAGNLLQTGLSIADSANSGAGSVNPTGTGNRFGDMLGRGVGAKTGSLQQEGRRIADSAKSGAGSVNPSRTGNEFGSQYASGIGSRTYEAMREGQSLASHADSGARSEDGYDAGSSFGSGFVSGIGGWIASAASKAAELARSALNAAKRALDSHSPSKKARKIGKTLPQGFGLGIEDDAGLAEKALANMAETALDALSMDELALKVKSIRLPEMMDSIYMAVEERNAKVAEKVTASVAAREKLKDSENQNLSVSKEDIRGILSDMSKLMVREIAETMEGMGVYLDKKPVGRIIAPVIDDELGRIGRRKT